jgi:hypothetical protein
MTYTDLDRPPLRALFESLCARRRPEDVAEGILEVLGDALDASGRRTLERAARGSLKRRLFGYTSMLEEFARPVGMNRQVARARELFQTAYPLNEDLCSHPAAVEEFIHTVGAEIGKTFGASDFKHNRLSKPERDELGLDLSRRGYNKRFRLLARMEAKLQRLVREIRKRDFQRIGKSGLASRLTWEEFAADVGSACFVAYYTARRNLRSEFTIAGQQKAYDDVAAMGDRCLAGGDVGPLRHQPHHDGGTARKRLHHLEQHRRRLEHGPRQLDRAALRPWAGGPAGPLPAREGHAADRG